MSGYTCRRCGHSLGITMWGGVQDCPNCRTVDAINKQTEQLKKQQAAQQKYIPPPQQVYQPIQNNNSGDSFGLFDLMLIFTVVTLLGYGVWLGLEFLWDHKWWTLAGLAVTSIFLINKD